MGQFSGTEPYIRWGGAFSDAELDAIIAQGDAMKLGSAAVKSEGKGENLHSVRSAKIGFFDQSPENKWLYDRIAAVVSKLNEMSYRFELAALERFQYTVYDQPEQDHYDWHVDQGMTARPRKLSLVLQLSSPSDYEGCNLEIMPSARVETMSRDRGSLVVFPSYILHRVTPISSGIRRSLVMWCSGPRFR